MPNHTPAPTMAPDKSLSLIYIPGWQYAPENSHIEHSPMGQAALDKLQAIDRQQALLSESGIIIFDAATHPQTSPKEVIKQLDMLVSSERQKGLDVGLIGHAIGGYYGAYMAERYHLPAILINPLIKAYKSLLLADMLEDHPGLLTLAQEQLKALETGTTHPDSIMLMLQKGDLLQDYQQALAYYPHCQQIVLNGGHHGFADLADWVDAMMGFFRHYYEHKQE